MTGTRMRRRNGTEGISPVLDMAMNTVRASRKQRANPAACLPEEAGAPLSGERIGGSLPGRVRERRVTEDTKLLRVFPGSASPVCIPVSEYHDPGSI